MKSIKGKAAFITGGASGIGLAMAESLLARGAFVMIADIDEAALDREIARLGPQATGYRLDVRDRLNWAAACEAFEAHFGVVDILVNNAGIGPSGDPLVDMEPASFDRVVSTNLTGVFNGISTFGIGMRDKGCGHIVNTASMAGLVGMATVGAYCASKFAVVGLSEVLRAEMAPHNVGVSVLCPGVVRSNLERTTIAAGGGRVTAGHTSTMAGIDPRLVGELVAQGILSNQLYIQTHGDYKFAIGGRLARLVASFDGVPSWTTAPDPGMALVEGTDGQE